MVSASELTTQSKTLRPAVWVHFGPRLSYTLIVVKLQSYIAFFNGSEQIIINFYLTIRPKSYQGVLNTSPTREGGRIIPPFVGTITSQVLFRSCVLCNIKKIILIHCYKSDKPPAAAMLPYLPSILQYFPGIYANMPPPPTQ